MPACGRDDVAELYERALSGKRGAAAMAAITSLGPCVDVAEVPGSGGDALIIMTRVSPMGGSSFLAVRTDKGWKVRTDITVYGVSAVRASVGLELLVSSPNRVASVYRVRDDLETEWSSPSTGVLLGHDALVTFNDDSREQTILTRSGSGFAESAKRIVPSLYRDAAAFLDAIRKGARSDALRLARNSAVVDASLAAARAITYDLDSLSFATHALPAEFRQPAPSSSFKWDLGVYRLVFARTADGWRADTLQRSDGDGGPATAAALAGPAGVVTDREGNLYVADAFHHLVRKVSKAGVIIVVAGTGAAGFSGDGGPATQAQLSGPWGLALGPDGSLNIADASNGRVRRVAPDGTISTVAGDLGRVVGVAVDRAGTIYVAVLGGGLKRIGTDGVVTPFAASAVTPPADADDRSSPWGIAVDPSGNVYVADTAGNRVLRIDPSEKFAVIAGTGAAGFAGDGGSAAKAQLNRPFSVAVDASGAIYIADSYNDRIRRVGPDESIATIAGNGIFGGRGDTGRAIEAQLMDAFGVGVDANGTVYIADSGNDRVRAVRRDGTIMTAAGAGRAAVPTNPTNNPPELDIWQCEFEGGCPHSIVLMRDGRVVTTDDRYHLQERTLTAAGVDLMRTRLRAAAGIDVPPRFFPGFRAEGFFGFPTEYRLRVDGREVRGTLDYGGGVMLPSPAGEQLRTLFDLNRLPSSAWLDNVPRPFHGDTYRLITWLTWDAPPSPAPAVDVDDLSWPLATPFDHFGGAFDPWHSYGFNSTLYFERFLIARCGAVTLSEARAVLAALAKAGDATKYDLETNTIVTLNWKRFDGTITIGLEAVGPNDGACP